MTKGTDSSPTWYHAPFGRRVMNPNPPYFVICEGSTSKDRNALRRRALNELAGL